MDRNERIGFIGLGAMGGPMARNLLKAGFSVSGLDVERERMNALAQAGAKTATTPAELARAVDLVFACLPSGQVVEAVVTGPDGLLEGCREGHVFCDMTTNFPSDSARLAARLAERGVAMLDAPISGGAEGAAEGTLSIMVGGNPAAFERCLPAFQAMGRQVTRMGDAVGAGGHAKLANQIMVYLNLASLLEALTYAAQAGLELDKLIPALEAGHANSAILNNKGRKAAARDFSAEGPVWMGHKDLTYVVRAMDEMGIRLPFTPQVQALLERLVERGQENLDQVVMIELLEEMAGISPGTRGEAGEP